MLWKACTRRSRLAPRDPPSSQDLPFKWPSSSSVAFTLRPFFASLWKNKQSARIRVRTLCVPVDYSSMITRHRLYYCNYGKLAGCWACLGRVFADEHSWLCGAGSCAVEYSSFSTSLIFMHYETAKWLRELFSEGSKIELAPYLFIYLFSGLEGRRSAWTNSQTRCLYSRHHEIIN